MDHGRVSGRDRPVGGMSADPVSEAITPAVTPAEALSRGLRHPDDLSTAGLSSMVQSATVYLAGPIDFAESGPNHTLAEYRRSRTSAVELLNSAGFMVYAPHRAWSVSPGAEPDPAIEAVNRTALAQCALLIALLPEGIPTIGTVLEIGEVARTGRPVVVIGGRGSNALAALPGVFRVDTVQHAVRTAQAMRDSGQLRPRGVEPTALAFTMEGGSESLLPVRHYRDDAALDLFVNRSTTIAHQEFVDVPAGCQVELPPGTWGLILGRSSTIRRRRVLVVPGVIDVGYRGDLFVGCYNVSGSTQTIAAGERVGQLIVMPNLTEHYRPVRAESLSDSERGTAGFGSTGGFNSNGGS